MNNYFNARGVNPTMYENAKLPAYFKEVLESLPQNAKILDFGCGFGQILLSLKKQNFAFKYGGGIQHTSLFVESTSMMKQSFMCKVKE